jgi:hypothetical protein
MTPISIAEIIDIIGADVIQESEDDICISKIETDSRHILFPEKTIFLRWMVSIPRDIILFRHCQKKGFGFL